MRSLLEIVLAAAELDDRHLARLALLQHLGADTATLEQRATHLDVGTFTDQQDLVELDRCTFVRFDLLETQDITCCRAVLFAARAKNRIHRIVLQ